MVLLALFHWRINHASAPAFSCLCTSFSLGVWYNPGRRTAGVFPAFHVVPRTATRHLGELHNLTKPRRFHHPFLLTSRESHSPSNLLVSLLPDNPVQHLLPTPSLHSSVPSFTKPGGMRGTEKPGRASARPLTESGEMVMCSFLGVVDRIQWKRLRTGLSM